MSRYSLRLCHGMKRAVLLTAMRPLYAAAVNPPVYRFSPGAERLPVAEMPVDGEGPRKADFR